jgi:hypothetical protein
LTSIFRRPAVFIWKDCLAGGSGIDIDGDFVGGGAENDNDVFAVDSDGDVLLGLRLKSAK